MNFFVSYIMVYFTVDNFFEDIINNYLINRKIFQLLVEGNHHEESIEANKLGILAINNDELFYSKILNKFNGHNNNNNNNNNNNDNNNIIPNYIPKEIENVYLTFKEFILFFKYDDKEKQKKKYLSISKYINNEKNKLIKNEEIFNILKNIISNIKILSKNNYQITASDLKFLIYYEIKNKFKLKDIVNVDVNNIKHLKLWNDCYILCKRFIKKTKITNINEKMINLIDEYFNIKYLIISNNYLIQNSEVLDILDNKGLFNNENILQINEKNLKIDYNDINSDYNSEQKKILLVNIFLLNYIRDSFFGLNKNVDIVRNIKFDDETKNYEKSIFDNRNNYEVSKNKLLMIKVINTSIISIDLYLKSLLSYLKNSYDKFFDLRNFNQINELFDILIENEKPITICIVFVNYLTIKQITKIFSYINKHNFLFIMLGDYLNTKTIKYFKELNNITNLNLQILIDVRNFYEFKHQYYNKYVDCFTFKKIMEDCCENYYRLETLIQELNDNNNNNKKTESDIDLNNNINLCNKKEKEKNIFIKIIKLKNLRENININNNNNININLNDINIKSNDKFIKVYQNLASEYYSKLLFNNNENYNNTNNNNYKNSFFMDHFYYSENLILFCIYQI